MAGPGTYSLASARLDIDVGQLGGPLQRRASGVISGYSVFQVAEKQSERVLNLDEVYESVKRMALDAKIRHELEVSREDECRHIRIDTDEDLLNRLPVATTQASGRPIDMATSRRLP